VPHRYDLNYFNTPHIPAAHLSKTPVFFFSLILIDSREIARIRYRVYC